MSDKPLRDVVLDLSQCHLGVHVIFETTEYREAR